MKEIWKAIEGYEGLYEVSNHGNVKSLKRKCESRYWRPVRERILRQAQSKNGYYGVILSKNKNKKRYHIARLVLIAFLPNPENKPQVNDNREIYRSGLFTQKSIALEYGVDQSLISYIINKKIWRHLLNAS